MKLGLGTQQWQGIALLAIALLLTSESLVLADTSTPYGKTRTDPANEPKKPSAEKTHFTVGVGVGAAHRSYLFPSSSSVNSLQLHAYSSSAVPFVRVYGQVFPLSQLPGLGLAGSVDKQRQSTSYLSNSNSVTTIAKAWQVNLQYRHTLGDLEITGELGVGGQMSRFLDTDQQLLAQLPSVDYLIRRLGLQAGHPLGKRARLDVGAALLIPAEVGEVAMQSETRDSGSGHQLSVSGYSGFIGVSYPIQRNLRLRLLYSGSHYSHEYRSLLPSSSASASDDFRSLGLSLNFVQ